MHKNDFDTLLRNVHFSAKLQIAKIHKMPQRINCYLLFSYKLYLAQNLPLCLRNPHSISPFPKSRHRTGYILASHAYS